MIIDTYVYFVSYTYNTDEILLGSKWSEVIRNTPLNNYESISHCSSEIKKEGDYKEICISNFILLDSYNKEEREKV
jgi:hypothetical protein